MSIDNFKLRVKTLIPLGLMTLALAAMVAFGALKLAEVSASASHVIEGRDLAAVQLVRANRAIEAIPTAIKSLLLVDTDSPMGKAAQEDYAAAGPRIVKLLDEAAAALPEHAAEIIALRDRAKAFADESKSAYKLAYDAVGVEHGRNLKPEELDAIAKAAAATTTFDDKARKLITEVVAFTDKIIAENAAAAQGLRASSSQAIVTLVAAGAAAAILSIAVALWMTIAKIERPLTRLGETMRRLAGGDLTVDVEGAQRRDEVGEMAKAVEVFKVNAVERKQAEATAAQARAAAEAERERAAQERARIAQTQTEAMTALRDGLKRLAEGDLLTRLDQGFSAEYADVRDDFNAAAAKLKAALAAVVASTGAIHSSSREISTASDNLSQRTEQQAASLEETAAALEQITTTVKTSAEGAKHASEVASTADRDAKQGAVVVRKAVAAMDAISDSSNKIGTIIGVIDEIAFQTNLLALNAGVEAARAGESGRGFAVVASEVRALAQRSAEAAKEIKTLVSESGAQVEEGVKLVAESGKTLEGIIAQVSEINRVVADIANGAQQQATGLQQINAAISQMDQSTQQNATMVEESTAASHSLSQEMTQLSSLVEQFRVGEAGEDRLRRDLKKAAPHAFAKPAPAPALRAAPKMEILRPAKAAAGGAKAANDWTEF